MKTRPTAYENAPLTAGMVAIEKAPIKGISLLLLTAMQVLPTPLARMAMADLERCESKGMS